MFYEIKARVGAEVETETIEQDDISVLRQQYIDLNRQRWNDAVPTVPTRLEFSEDYSTANYSFQEYGQDRPLIIMNMGTIAKDIRANEVDSLVPVDF